MTSSSHGARLNTSTSATIAPEMPPTWGKAPVRTPAMTASTRTPRATASNRFTGRVSATSTDPAGSTCAGGGRQPAAVDSSLSRRRGSPSARGPSPRPAGHRRRPLIVYVPGSSSPRSTTAALYIAISMHILSGGAALPSFTVSRNALPSRATVIPASALHGSTPLHQATRTATSRPLTAASSFVAETAWTPVRPATGVTIVGSGLAGSPPPVPGSTGAGHAGAGVARLRSRRPGRRPGHRRRRERAWVP